MFDGFQAGDHIAKVEKAKALLEEQGWVKKDFSSTHGRCLGQALQDAYFGARPGVLFSSTSIPVVPLVDRAIVEVRGIYQDRSSVVDFNDHPYTTFDEIKHVLDLVVSWLRDPHLLPEGALALKLAH